MRIELGPTEHGLYFFDDWVDTVFERFRFDPYVCDNHIRPQTEFVDDGLQLFLLEEGLEKVMRWIDDVTQTAQASPILDRNCSRVPMFEICESTIWKIENFYARDRSLIKQKFRDYQSSSVNHIHENLLVTSNAQVAT